LFLEQPAFFVRPRQKLQNPLRLNHFGPLTSGAEARAPIPESKEVQLQGQQLLLARQGGYYCNDGSLAKLTYTAEVLQKNASTAEVVLRLLHLCHKEA
jgi:hypothetical protein